VSPPNFLQKIAREFRVCIIGGLVIENQNCALAIAPTGEILARYAKQKPFLPGGEPYSPGTESSVFNWQGTTVALFVCYDLRFPELFRAAAARHRPELFVVIASWPEARILHWERLLCARAIENQAYVIGVNRTGNDPTFYYPESSGLWDWNGERVSHSKVDIAALAEYRKRLPFLDDLSHGPLTLLSVAN
jgi:omega-amidase